MLVSMLLEKQPENRPSVAEILQMDVIKKKMIEFVKSKGQTLQGGKTIYNKQVPTIVQKAQPQPQQ